FNASLVPLAYLFPPDIYSHETQPHFSRPAPHQRRPGPNRPPLPLRAQGGEGPRNRHRANLFDQRAGRRFQDLPDAQPMDQRPAVAHFPLGPGEGRGDGRERENRRAGAGDRRRLRGDAQRGSQQHEALFYAPAAGCRAH
nr:hypothetical protein [Tanacetum cinerariifolium]